MNAVGSLEATVSLDGLLSLDYKKLTSVLEAVFARLKFQEGLIRDNARATEIVRGEVGTMMRSMQQTEETIASFAHAVEDVNKMKDRVSAWSERFKSLEEQHFALQGDISASAEALEARLQAMEASRQEAHISLLSQVKASQDQREQRTQDRLSVLSSGQEELKIDLRVSIDRLEKSLSARLAEVVGQIDPPALPSESEELSEPAAPEESQVAFIQPPNGPLRSALMRIKTIEMKLSDMSVGAPDLGLESMGLDVDLIHTEIGKDRLIMELQNKLFVIVTQANQFADRLEQMRSYSDPAVPLTPSDLQLPKFTRFVSIHQRLEEVENSLQERLKRFTATEDRIESLSQRFDMLQARLREGRGQKLPKTMSRQFTIQQSDDGLGMVSPKSSAPGISPERPLFPERTDDIREEVENFRTFLEAMEETIEKMRKVVMEKVSHDEAEEIAAMIIKRVTKSMPMKSGVVQESEGKVAELEARLNNYWRSIQDVQSHIHQLRETLADMDSKLRHLIDEKVVEMHEELASSISPLAHKAEEVQVTLNKLTEEKMTEELLENEQYLRSMVLKLKNDVQKVQTEMETLASRKAEAQPLMQEINFDELPEELESKKLRIVLQQHDQAIRYLASRLTGYGMPDDSGLLGKSQDNSAALVHMEQLRAEMKEVLAKHEASKPLSAKDMELLNEILAALDTKISKEELTTKVDKAELVKIYRQLKRKTDQLADAVKRSETAGFGGGRDDVFFSKKRLDAECASCGQLLPENCDLQTNVYQPWGRFPPRANLMGPGFSHILQSLVSSPTGSISIPRRFDDPEERSAPSSPCAPRSRVKRRNQVKLPSVR